MDLEMGAASAARDEGGVGGAPAAAPAAAMTNAPPQRNATPSWWRWERAKHPKTAQGDASATDDIAKLTSRTLQRTFKALVLLALLATAAVGAGMAYKLGHDAETRTFRLQFDASAKTLHANIQFNMNSQLTTANLCAKYVSALPDRGGGIGTNLPYFHEFAGDLQNVARGTSALTWLQLVTEPERPGFEAAAAQAAQQLDASGALAAQVREFGIRAAPADNPEPTGAPQPTRFVRAPPAPLHASIWANEPRDFTAAYFLYDAFSEPVRRDALQRVVDTSAPAMSEPTPFTSLDAPGTIAPSAVIYAPAWPHLRANRTWRQPSAQNASVSGAAVCGVAFHWDAVLQDALPSFVNSIVAVLRSPRGAEYTFQIRGREVYSVGLGDASGRLARHFRRLGQQADVEVAGAQWRVTLFPTDELQSRYLTHKPRDFALCIAAAGAVCALLYVRCCLWFEFGDRDRIKRVNARLLAYVADLEHMQRQLAEGSAREADAKARVLAEEASSRAKDAFVAMVSHEIRTPLNAVSGAAALLAATPLDGEQRELVTLLEAGTAHVVLIVEDILIAGALASGSFAVARERLRLETVVLGPAWRMVLMQRSQQAKLRAMHLSRAVADDVPEEIVGDSTRLTQVLTNILSNSIKFTPEGGSIHLQVDVTDEPPAGWAPLQPAAEAVERAPRWLRFRVTDTGIGVGAENIERIFAPFVQAEQSTMRQYGGTGLGLTICRRIARAMGGDLTATSEGLGHGTMLTFSIPLCVPAAGDGAVAAEEGGQNGGGEPVPGTAAAATAATAGDESTPAAPESDDSGSFTAALSPSTPRAQYKHPIAGGAAAAPPWSLLATPPPPSPPPSPSMPGRPIAPGAANVLVAEDDALSQVVMRKLLTALRLRFTLVGNGAAAVEAYKQDVFDLVLMDLHMPILDGHGATRAIRALVARGERPPTPIVALTASCSEHERQCCTASGMSELMPKPVRLDTLRSLVQRYTHPSGA